MKALTVAAVLAAETTAIDWTPVTDALTGQFTVGTIMGVIGVCIAGGIGFVAAWFGARKINKSVTTAFKTGKIKF